VREIHDSSLGGLAGIELQMQVLEQRVSTLPHIMSEVERIRRLLNQESLNLRDLMGRLRPISVTGADLPSALADLAERFSRETGVPVDLAPCDEPVDLPPMTCRELVRIVQEALNNVRKHSGARHVSLGLERLPEHWRLTVEDDGKGFDFAGSMCLEALNAARKGPLVIKERVRAFGGDLNVTSMPGLGARLEVLVPLDMVVARA